MEEKKTIKPVIDTQPRKRRFNSEKDIRTDLWEEMELGDLYNQRILLANRATYCMQKGYVQAVAQMKEGMRTLELLIEKKEKNRKLTRHTPLI